MDVDLLKTENEKLKFECARLRSEVEVLRRRLEIYEGSAASEESEIPSKNNGAPHAIIQQNDVSAPLTGVHNGSTPMEKIKLFMSLFRGRTDVFAYRWKNENTGVAGYSPACDNAWKSGLCDRKKYRCTECPNRKFKPLDEKVIEAHLRGESEKFRDVVGIYPLLPDETCYFIVADFDDEGFESDAAAFRKICDKFNIPVSVERSRSGSGAHAWFFFSEAVSAALARKFASCILTRAMSERHEISFKSYDKLIPGQDIMPKGGLGNLVTLPLQGRARKLNNSVFVDNNFKAYPDQWAYLSGVKKLSRSEVESLVNMLCRDGELGTLARTADDDEKPWERGRPEREPDATDFSGPVSIVCANMIHVEKCGISQFALNRIKRLAAFKNPEFYKAQAMRLPVRDKPRIINTCDETPKYLSIPRGCRQALIDLLEKAGAKFTVENKTNPGKSVKIKFKGELRESQKPAAEALTNSDNGVLSAATAFGKTVIGASIIASKKVNALILVHTQALLTQWKEALEKFLAIDEAHPEQPQKRGKKASRSPIGLLGGGKSKLGKIVDIALIQSLVRGDEAKEFVKDYGLVIVDECHHVPAISFETVMKEVNARFVYGLTATPVRQDGHHPIIFMQCGPLRYSVDARTEADKRPFEHFISPRFTNFKRAAETGSADISIVELYSELARNEFRNSQIAGDALKCVENGRSPIILTGRTDHVEALSELIKNRCPNVIVLVGRDSQKEKRNTMEKLNKISKSEPLVIVATGKYVGEGFDYPRLDTLLLAMPVAWRGTIAQYAGRLHRIYEGKNEVVVYDYVDIHVPVLERMYHKRLKGYAQIGYKVRPEGAASEKTDVIFDENTFWPVFSNDVACASREVSIVSPFMKQARTRQIMKLFYSAAARGAEISVVTRPPDNYREDDRANIAELAKSLEGIGVRVSYKKNMHQKYAIIDRRIVWYGSVNFMSFGSRSVESLMRLESYDIAGELLANI